MMKYATDLYPTSMVATARNVITMSLMSKPRKKDRHLKKPVTMRLDSELVRLIRSLAKEGRRPFTSEFAIALEKAKLKK